MADPLSDVQLLELQLLGDDFARASDDTGNFLACLLLPFVRWCRAERVTLASVQATKYENIPHPALCPLILAVSALDPAKPLCPLLRTVRKLVSAITPS